MMKYFVRNAFYTQMEKTTLLQMVLMALALFFITIHILEFAWPYIVHFYLFLKIKTDIKLSDVLLYCLEFISISVLIYNLYGFLKIYYGFIKIERNERKKYRGHILC